ncbi:MAG: hydrogenase maturation nickel metallochaperone HypA [Candidatus Cloacimonetes bacterium]|nr:hydrogenase maturation nickel metallochaperone HypA [Candidatus Cloacimonadota bacterium]
MHEGAIAQALVNAAHNVAVENGSKPVEKVLIVVGKMHQIVPSVLETYFDMMKEDFHLLSNAKLVYTEQELLIFCKDCNTESILETYPIFMCPKCESFSTEVVQGEELYIESLIFYKEEPDGKE